MNVYGVSIFLVLFFYAEAETIINLYMDQSLSMLKSGRDGYLIATLSTQENTTICNYKFSDADANVACLTLGYPAQGISMVGPSVTRSDPVLIGDIACAGTEAHINQCISSGRKVFGKPCSSHTMDAYVACLQDKVAPQINTNVGLITCNSTNGVYGFIPVEGMKNTGFLTFNSNYVCNSGYTITQADARTLCLYFCNNVAGALPTMSKPGVPDTATFVTMSPPNYVGVSTASCPSSSVLALQCAPEPVVVESSPNITCNTQNITALWNAGFQPPIIPSLISLTTNCPDTSFQISSNATYDSILTINFIGCNAILSATATSVSYSYVITRAYNSSSLISTAPRNLTIACIFPKSDSSNQSVSVDIKPPVYLNSSTTLPVVMNFYTDQTYSTLMPLDKSSMYTIYDSNLMYVKVTLQSTVGTLALGLVNCKIATVNTMEETTSSNSLNLITSSCPSNIADYKVSIYPLSRKDMGFQFKPYVIGGNNTIYVLCETTKCFMDTADVYCRRCDANSRRKRSIMNIDTVVQGPIVIV